MWFNQLQLFSLAMPKSWDAERLKTQLESFTFRTCLAHNYSSLGWVPPCGDDEHSPLVQSIPDYYMICCQFEEKILPATVIQQALKEKIKQMTEGQATRKVSIKEKQQLKEAITQSLLPRAFTKMTRVYAYIDKKSQMLCINTTNTYKTEQFIGLIQRTLEKKIIVLDHKKNSAYYVALVIER